MNNNEAVIAANLRTATVADLNSICQAQGYGNSVLLRMATLERLARRFESAAR
jgi:hypothetical protein